MSRGVSSGTFALALMVVFGMAGFESAAFFGAEARRPLITVTRAVLVTPILCGTVFVFAGWAALTGHADVVVAAYFEGTASGASTAMVVAVKVGVTFSWFASALGCAQAGSRLLLAMGIEGTVRAKLGEIDEALAAARGALELALGERELRGGELGAGRARRCGHRHRCRQEHEAQQGPGDQRTLSLATRQGPIILLR